LDDDRFASYSSYNPDSDEIVSSFRKRLGFVPSRTGWTDKSIFDYVNGVGKAGLILNLGSGMGRFDKMIEHEMINLDVSLNDGTDIIADAHKFPIKDNSLDCVFSNAVLEHLKRPWLVAEEMYRVLKSNGLVCINVPFLNVGHEDHDYHRFTGDGLRSVFHQFREIKAGPSSGPGSFAAYFLPEYIALFFPSSKVRTGIRYAFALLCLPLKHFDPFLKKRDRYSIIADAFYFVGRKAGTMPEERS